VDDFFNKLLPRDIVGVGFSGEDELYGAVGVEEETLEPVGIMKEESGPFVGGKPTGETDGQRIGREYLIGLGNL